MRLCGLRGRPGTHSFGARALVVCSAQPTATAMGGSGKETSRGSLQRTACRPMRRGPVLCSKQAAPCSDLSGLLAAA